MSDLYWSYFKPSLQFYFTTNVKRCWLFVSNLFRHFLQIMCLHKHQNKIILNHPMPFVYNSICFSYVRYKWRHFMRVLVSISFCVQIIYACDEGCLQHYFFFRYRFYQIYNPIITLNINEFSHHFDFVE
jgi:hypothetical protein